MVALTHQMVRGKTRLESMDDVRNLNLWGQDLDDISLLKEMQLVEILSFSVNRIASLSNFRNCGALQELYLRKNEVVDISELHYLRGLQSLKVTRACVPCTCMHMRGTPLSMQCQPRTTTTILWKARTHPVARTCTRACLVHAHAHTMLTRTQAHRPRPPRPLPLPSHRTPLCRAPPPRFCGSPTTPSLSTRTTGSSRFGCCRA
jgi:hypothetical protein